MIFLLGAVVCAVMFYGAWQLKLLGAFFEGIGCIIEAIFDAVFDAD